MATIDSVLTMGAALHAADHALRDARKRPGVGSAEHRKAEREATRLHKAYTAEWSALSEPERKSMGMMHLPYCRTCGF